MESFNDDGNVDKLRFTIAVEYAIVLCVADARTPPKILFFRRPRVCGAARRSVQ
jgi:hypothetical protein